MITKHFLKTCILFTAMIALGLIGVFLVSHYDIANKGLNNEDMTKKEPCPTTKSEKPC